MLGRESGPLGLLTTNRTTTMGFHCIPTRPDDQQSTQPDILQGRIHRPDEPCPFDADRFPERLLGTCCSLQGFRVACELMAFGERNLAGRMFTDKTDKEALAFARELVCAADALEGKYGDKRRKPRGAPRWATWDIVNKAWVWQGYSSFEEAIAVIRAAARWYERIASVGDFVRVE